MRRKSRYLQKAYRNRRLRIRKRLCALHRFLKENPDKTPEIVSEYIRNRIKGLLDCGKPYKKTTRLSFCRSGCFCERCGYIKRHDYVKPLAEFMKTENTPLYFFVRKERFVDKSLTFEELEQRMTYFEKQKREITRSMIKGSAGLDGLIQRIEILPFKDKLVTCLTTLFISTKPKVNSDSYFWKGYYVFDDHADHKAIRKKLGLKGRKEVNYIISDRKMLKRVINNTFTTKTRLYSYAQNEDLINIFRIVKRKRLWTSGGPIFKKK